MKKPDIKKIKTCVNCRHLDIIEEGQEKLDDNATPYILYKCDVFNYIGKEIFSYPQSGSRIVIERDSDDECPFWEEWIKENGESRGLKDNDVEPKKASSDDPDEY